MNIIREEKSIKIDFEGTFDKQDEEELERFVVQELQGVSKLSFDAKGVADISSTGLRILAYAQGIMNEQGMMYVEHAGERVEWLCRAHDILCSKSDRWLET